MHHTLLGLEGEEKNQKEKRKRPEAKHVCAVGVGRPELCRQCGLDLVMPCAKTSLFS